MSALLVLIGLALAALGATASVAVRAVSRLELTRWVARRLEGADAAVTLLSRPGDVAAAADALVAVGVALAGVCAPWALRSAELGTTLAFELLLGVPVLCVVAYFLPRAVGRRWPEKLVRDLVPRLRPGGTLVGRIVRGRAATERAELAALLRDSATAGLAGEDELEIVTGVMAFADRVVREVMTPRTRIVAAPENAGAAELAALVTSSGYTRIPVYRSSRDEIVGMVHAFDVIKAGPGGKVGVRPVSVVPGSRRCADALLDLRRDRRHMAVVLDEFGGTAGLVTMEDLLEELVGEIFDELDEPRQQTVAPERGVLVVDAGYPLESVRQHFGLSLEAPPRVETAGGYLAWGVGRIPKAGERTLLGELEFDVLEATPTRLVRLVIRAAAPAGAVPASVPRTAR
ncbi:MAG TPA: hemolysin family protein [Gemmatimonadales bacterium]|nr:hemolysin family protein [Gemmatimonadales bacterium]